MARKRENKLGFSTRALHYGYDPKQHNSARVTPIYQTMAYLFDDVEQAARLCKLEEIGFTYTRINNPTTAILEERIASLESGDYAVALASGMAAISSALLTLLRAGDEILSSASLYGGTYSFFSTTLPKFGIKANFVQAANVAHFEKGITEKTKLIFAETIGNPRIDIPDLAAIAEVAHKRNIPFFVDNTVATPYLCRPIEHGADVVIHSASKFIGGQGAALGGLVVASDAFEWVRAFPSLKQYDDMGVSPFGFAVRNESLRDFGAALSPFHSFLFIQGLETLSLRMEKHSRNAEAVARFLKSHSAVEYVNYPLFEDHPSFNNARKYLPKGCGALLSFGVKGGLEAGKRVVNSMKLISHLANLGDAKTLILHPASTTHEHLSAEERIAAGAPDELIRISVGIEDVEDIISELERGLENV
ncbi:MAG: homocysteine synthase [Myxococcota bacterium]